jgi:hypothetical protein
LRSATELHRGALFYCFFTSASSLTGFIDFEFRQAFIFLIKAQIHFVHRVTAVVPLTGRFDAVILWPRTQQAALSIVND